MEMGPTALQHRDQLEDVKRRLGIEHEYFDCWIYNFLENKFFDVDETVAKLHRRDAMERDEIGSYEVTDFMREQMSKGLIQLIGDDREGRVTFYIVTARDKPLASKRDENKRNFDMWMSYGTRLRKENKRCRITMLINQDGASMWSNTDMAFQSNIALRIAKFYPGCVDRMYICRMGRTLSAMAKPIFKSLPKVVSERIHIITEYEMERGKLLEYFEPHVLPRALGGESDIDCRENWSRFAETIESHFLRLRDAIRSGKRVKEWEIEELTKQLHDEQVQRMEMSLTLRQHSPPSGKAGCGGGPDISDDDADLKTCESFDGDGGDEKEMTSLKNIHLRQWQKALSPFNSYSHCLHDMLGMIEFHEEFFRSGIIELELADYLRLCDYFSTHALRIGHSNQDMEMDDATPFSSPSSRQRLALTCPKPLRAVARALLWVMCLIISVYFFAGTIFLASVSCCIVALMFFGIFVKSYYVFPLGLGALVAGYQGCMIASRGVELVRGAFRGQLMPFLTFLGAQGLTIQALLFALIIVGQFIVFTVFSSINEPLTGLRISFATGWLCCAVLIAIHHLTFSQNEKSGQDKNHRVLNLGALSLYLFLDITEDGDHLRSPGTELALCSVPITLAIIFGLAFIVSNAVFFLVAGLVTTMGSSFLVNFFTEGGHGDHTTTLVRIVTSLASISWLFLFYSVGHRNWWEEFRPVVIVVSTATAILVALCAFIRISRARQHFAMRMSFFLIACYFVVGIVLVYVVHWALGIFVCLMILQAAICFVRSTRSTSLAGTLLITIGSLSLLTACIIMGYRSSGSDYLVPYNISVTPSKPRYEMAVDPLCYSRLGSFGSSVDIVQLALFSTLSFASQRTAAFRTDLSVWAPRFNFSANLSTSSAAPFHGLVFDSMENNVTVVTCRSTTDNLLSVELLTMWVEAMSLAAFEIILPIEWTAGLIRYTDFTNFLIPFRWRVGLDELDEQVREMQRRRPDRNFILTGYGLGGGVAAILAARRNVLAATFDSPGIYLSQYKFSISSQDIIREYVVSVRSEGGISGIDSNGDGDHVVRCAAHAPCSGPWELLQAIQDTCVGIQAK